LQILEKYKKIIKNYQVKSFKRFGHARSLIAQVEFIDESVLYIRDYLFLNGKRKYVYHWQDRKGNLIIRWDNSPHYPELKTFPHHKHVGEKILESTETTLEEVLEEIEKRINYKLTYTS